jgi:hypothetical protein
MFVAVDHIGTFGSIGFEVILLHRVVAVLHNLVWLLATLEEDFNNGGASWLLEENERFGFFKR